MRPGSIQHFVLFIFLGISTSLNLTATIHSCQPATSEFEYSTDFSSKDLCIQYVSCGESHPGDQSTDNNTDCSCPAHRTGCGHSHVLVSRVYLLTYVSLSSSGRLGDFSIFIKPGPFLEGPFQPPRDETPLRLS